MAEQAAYEGPARPVGGPGAWRGDNLRADPSWMIDLGEAERAEILAAFKAVGERDFLTITRQDMALPRLDVRLAELRVELESGRGFALIRGLPIDGLSDDEVRLMWWGLGTHFAPAVVQNRAGDRIWSVRDESAGANQKHDLNENRAGGNKPISSYAKARSNGPLRFHTDGVDALALLCVRTPAAGGTSKLASSVTVHDEILRRRPDLHALLCRDYHRTYESTNNPVDRNFYALPVFTRVGDYFSCQYSRTYVEEAQREGAPKMSRAQDEALDLLAEVAEETCLKFDLEPGDMLFVNNHVCYHGREPFDDDASAGHDRLLLRLWFSPENSRPLAQQYLGIWNSILPGAVRSSRQRFDTAAAAE